MSYNATVHQPTDVLHTVGRDGAIRVWSVAQDGTPHPVEQTPIEPTPQPSIEVVLSPTSDPTATATAIARRAGIALEGGPTRGL